MARILVVDDEEALARLVQIQLQISGHDVTAVSDAQTALKAFTEEQPEVLVLDWMMPTMSGLQMLDELKRRGWRQNLRVVMITARVTEADILRAWQAGVDAYVSKPFEPENLAEVVQEVVDASPEELEQRRTSELRKARFLRALDDLLDES